MSERPGPEQENGADSRDRKAPQAGDWQETAVLLARISGIGWYVVGSIGGGLALGWVLDRQFGTEPVLLIVGLLLGVIAAFAGMVRLLSAVGKKRTKR